MTALGHRLKLLDAIAALRNDASGKAPSVDAENTASTQSARPEDRAERRQVTVMFSDLVGSTALSARMDPEDLREVISAYQKCVAETVQRFAGFVAKYMGDGPGGFKIQLAFRNRNCSRYPDRRDLSGGKVLFPVSEKYSWIEFTSFWIFIAQLAGVLLAGGWVLYWDAYNRMQQQRGSASVSTEL